MRTAMGGLVRVDPASGEAPFWQVRRQVSEAIADGRLPVGTKLPPIRGLADDLGLAANTVARAYKELEAAGLVLTRGRLGTVVASDAVDGLGADAAVRLAAGDYARAARAARIPDDDAVALVQEALTRLP
ncbi:GntR family transcriptional regulator [Ornithinibacter aureus]|nr:GntR family transcriptional regulator [Ornithinibacter aureus]